jgi:hypothetical protein
MEKMDKRRPAALFFLAAAITFALVRSSFAETRVALVIGNGAYQNAPQLPNPPNDAADVAAALKRDGFDTILATNLTRDGMQDAAIRFSRAARDADVALFYYSGHAIQFAGVNYLAPVDTQLNDEADLRRMVRVDEIVSDLQQAKNLRILVLDACRDNPLADQLKRSIGATRSQALQRGLAKIDSPQGMIVAYATQAGRTAEDGDGRNSPYTAAFLRNIEAKDEIGTIFRHISSDVYEKTRHEQLPELSLSLVGEFYLQGKGEVGAAPDTSSAPPGPPAKLAALPAPSSEKPNSNLQAAPGAKPALSYVGTIECAAKYQTAKIAGKLNGRKWDDFRAAECGPQAMRASVEPTSVPNPAPSSAPAGDAVFPSAIDPKYAKEFGGIGRMHTCADQYNANKVNNANGGMKWIDRGGGYYGECSKRLKGT